MNRLSFKFISYLIIFAIFAIANHCILEGAFAKQELPTEHSCPVDGTSHQHGTPCKSPSLLALKNSKAQIQATIPLIFFSGLFTNFISLVEPETFHVFLPNIYNKNSKIKLITKSLITQLVLAPNAPPHPVFI